MKSTVLQNLLFAMTSAIRDDLSCSPKSINNEFPLKTLSLLSFEWHVKTCEHLNTLFMYSIPVSYTHLDVYKRQPKCSSLVNC